MENGITERLIFFSGKEKLGELVFNILYKMALIYDTFYNTF